MPDYKTEPIELMVVIPVYNERENIHSIVKLADELAGRTGNSRVLVVDDGSTDGTGAALHSLKSTVPRLHVVTQANAGHGAAVLAGYREAIHLGAQWIFQIDSDNSFDIDDFMRLWGRREESPFILGWRKKRQDPFYRKILTRGAVLTNKVLFGASIPDANIPFRLMKADCLKHFLNQEIMKTFAPNIWLSVLATRAGIPLLNIPIHNLNRMKGEGSLYMRNMGRVILRCVGDAIRFKFFLLKHSDGQ